MGFIARSITRFLCGGAAIASVALAATSVHAQNATPQIEIKGGGKPLQVAVQRFANDPNSAEAVEGFYTELAEALRFGGVAIVDPAGFLEPKQTADYSRSTIACDNWRGIGTNFLVQGVLEKPSAGRPQRVRYRLWDTDLCRLRGDPEYIEFPDEDLWLIARRMADEIILRITGRRGVAATQIAFVSNTGGNKEIYVMEAADGSRRTRVTGNGRINLFPAWSPDASRLLYTSYREGLPDLWLLGRGNVKGRRLLNLPKEYERSDRYRAVFGPTPDEVTFTMHKDKNTDIYVSDLEGGNLRRITQNRAIEIGPSWSPDGTRMVFTSDRTGTPQLYVLDRATGVEKRITYNGKYNSSPAWSPTGEYIVYSARTGLENFDLYAIDPDSLYTFPVVLHERVDEDPSWSPDGRKIAFASNRRGRREIYTVDMIDVRNVKRLTSDFGDCSAPSWATWLK